MEPNQDSRRRRRSGAKENRVNLAKLEYANMMMKRIFSVRRATEVGILLTTLTFAFLAGRHVEKTPNSHSLHSVPAQENSHYDRWLSLPDGTVDPKNINRYGFTVQGRASPPTERSAYANEGIENVIRNDGLVMEISPLASPLLPRDYLGYRSVDVVDKEGLLRKYSKDVLVDKSKIQEPDYIWSGQTYRELVGENEFFERVVASHVIEHVPDILAFLNGIADILTPSGELRLLFPDYRFCFDWSRQPSRLSDIIGASIENRTKPTPSDVYDFFALVHSSGVRNSPVEHWSRTLDEYMTERVVTPNEEWHTPALEAASRALREYVDVHVWRFDSQLFYDYMTSLSKLHLLKLELVNIVPARLNSFEIFATFKKI